MVIAGSLVQQLLVRLWCGRATFDVTVPARKVQRDLRDRLGALFVELARRKRVDRHHVRPEVTGELLGITPRTLGYPRHVAIDTRYAGRPMNLRILEIDLWHSLLWLAAVFRKTLSGPGKIGKPPGSLWMVRIVSPPEGP